MNHHRLALAAALVAGSCAPVASTGSPEPHAVPATAGEVPRVRVVPTDRRGPRAARSRHRVTEVAAAGATVAATTLPPVTTTTAPPAVAAPSVRTAPPTLPPPPASAAPGEGGGATIDAVLDCLAAGEGNPAYDRVHDSGRHFGRYGFDQPTWNGAVARAGYPEWSGRNPTEAPPHVQDAAARQLYAERGTQPWPPSVGAC